MTEITKRPHHNYPNTSMDI